jgi:hypothetical protein
MLRMGKRRGGRRSGHANSERLATVAAEKMKFARRQFQRLLLKLWISSSEIALSPEHHYLFNLQTCGRSNGAGGYNRETANGDFTDHLKGGLSVPGNIPFNRPWERSYDTQKRRSVIIS